MATRHSSHLAWKLSLSILVLVVTALTLLAANNLRANIDPKQGGTLAVALVTAGNQKYEIVGLDENSPFHAFGAKPGDLVSFERKSDPLRSLRAGEAVAVTLHTPNGARTSVIKAVLNPDIAANANTIAFLSLTQLAATLFTLALALAIGLRMADSPPMRGFAIALLADSVSFSALTLPASALQDAISLYLAPAAYGLTVLSFLYFALTFPQTAPWLQKKPVRIFFGALTCLLVSAIFLTWYDRYQGLAPVVSEFARRGRNALVMAVCASAATALYASWRRSEGAMRYRMAWIGVCLSAVVMVYLFTNLTGFANWPYTIKLDILSNAVIAAAYVGLAYGLLRHRLLNLSFAVNRTLAFTVTSLSLFLVFWLIEQVVHKLVHFDAAENNALLSGAIAFGLFFAFNRIHHRVEHWMEHLFFREWRANEQGLRQFMARGAHFLAGDALVAAFGAALDRFSDRAGNAIYLIGPDYQFDLAFGSIDAAPANLSADGNIAVTLRDTRTVLHLDAENPEVPGALVVPMLQGSLLKGFVVMGLKAGAQGYRPDEEAILAEAATRIALDMNRLEAAKAAHDLAQMAQERQLLLQRQVFLEQELAALHGVLSKAMQAVNPA